VATLPVLNIERFVCLRIPPSIVKWHRMRRLFPDELFSFRARRRSVFFGSHRCLQSVGFSSWNGGEVATKTIWPGKDQRAGHAHKQYKYSMG
jgi:hypothetical protein